MTLSLKDHFQNYVTPHEIVTLIQIAYIKVRYCPINLKAKCNFETERIVKKHKHLLIRKLEKNMKEIKTLTYKLALNL